MLYVGFHEYRKIWKPKLGQWLCVAFEKYNDYDPYYCTCYARFKGTIHGRCVVGHIPRELSWFCKYFPDYSGVIDATVTSVDFRRSPIPQGGIEIPINLHIIKSASSDDVFKRMKKIEQYYQEPNNIPLCITQNADTDNDIET